MVKDLVDIAPSLLISETFIHQRRVRSANNRDRQAAHLNVLTLPRAEAVGWSPYKKLFTESL